VGGTARPHNSIIFGSAVFRVALRIGTKFAGGQHHVVLVWRRHSVTAANALAITDCGIHRALAVGRRHRYLAAIRHPALPGPNSPVGSSRMSRRGHVGRSPTSLRKAAKLSQRSQTPPRGLIASHVANTGGSVPCLRVLLPVAIGVALQSPGQPTLCCISFHQRCRALRRQTCHGGKFPTRVFIAIRRAPARNG